LKGHVNTSFNQSSSSRDKTWLYTSKLQKEETTNNNATTQTHYNLDFDSVAT